ncbi:MAG: flavin reductase family protein, partial [Promethearchaeota archaeon]
NITEFNLKLNVWLFFGCLTEEDILFRAELDSIQSRRSNIKIKYILSEPETNWDGTCGFITKEIILDEIKSIEEKFFYIVGNRAMYSFIEEQLEELNIPRSRSIYELYGVPDDITKTVGWPKEITASNKVKVVLDFIKQGKKVQETIEVPCIEPLLNSLERKRSFELLINSGCRSGACALCRTKLKSGRVFMLPEVKMREIDQEFGFIHPCVAYPLTDIHLDLTLT